MSIRDITEAVFPQIPMSRELLNLWDGGDNGQQAEDAKQANINLQNYNMQKEFAQNSLRWKVEDAIKAGIHPLAALGAQGYSASPSSVAPQRIEKDNYMRNMLGQEITRAVLSTATSDERAISKLTQERLGLENELLRTQNIQAKMKLNPAFPSSVDEYLGGMKGGINDLNQNLIEEVPLRRTMSDPRAPHKEVGAIPDIQIVRTKNGYAVVPAQDVKNRIEDSPMEWQWLMRNVARLYDLPDGRKAYMDPATGQLVPVPFQQTYRKIRNKWRNR